jgi:hypothetical protein
MNYDYLTEGELMREASILAKQMSALSAQAEKLSTLKRDEKVPSAIYGEIVEDLANKIHGSRQTIDNMMVAAKDRAHEVTEEASRLKAQLELLEVRHAIGSVSDENYKVLNEHALKELQKSEHMVEEMEGLITVMQGCLNRFEGWEPTSTNGRAIPADQAKQVMIEEGAIQANSPVNTEVESSPPSQGVEKTCQRCGGKGPPTAHFCSNCGNKF